MRKGTTVRLTEQAHMLLLEKAEDYNTTMKAVASEAIFLFARGEDKDDERIIHLKARITRLKQAFVFYVLLIGIAMGILGFITGVHF